ncbi:Zn(II)2Cys6 transcription factor [Aspergillus homomorphus CBS 101889]|uniref:Zn(2)-C6 fungal-type domain-containing protein n=1 Tax=Aspergillus homomorphus (strain CBS 101889) TaxID=1450537 RepID=A0A395HKM4_ASPHC|nr:hypothetical protein BO97DRAFT_480882 [Aspergillus homomorphus CBS 101889]RAL08049.1 hypothetical protein BO97DRAFT_480882 [Aspergillus homomorphus CBS 101889]
MASSPVTLGSASENHANLSMASSKPRSCLVCRQRKVRCDKQSPCSNCRRGKIACISPSTADRPPRWARRLGQLPSFSKGEATTVQESSMEVGQMMDRLQSLENLVHELKGQLKQVHSLESADANSLAGGHSPESSTREDQASQRSSSKAGTNNIQTRFGRLVLQDDSHCRYVSSGFWSRVDDEMTTSNLLHDDSDSAEDEACTSQLSSVSEQERTAAERHAFLFGLNLKSGTPDLRELHPLPSQIPFMLETFAENVNQFLGIVHMPTVTTVVREWRSSGRNALTPSNNALLFAIYYATIASMEDEDVMTNFGSSKSELNLKYRLGLEHALAKADFLNAPDIVLVQAFTIFLYLSRRYDSPRFIWMMTGFVIRMAQYLGLQRDGAQFESFTPYEVELRRRAWWGVCLLDIRASEDQGTDLTIAQGAFDTKLPLNINDSDISPDTEQTPPERHGVTDMSIPRLSAHMTTIMREMMVRGVDHGIAGMQEQSRSVDEIYRKLDEEYLQHTAGLNSIVSWVAINLIRLVMAKMTLIVFLPVLFSTPSQDLSEELRTKLLCAAIEVAEYNHALNAEQSSRHLRWLYQTCTHWHAIVYLLIEISRRPWSPFVERAWVALHSSWLIPAPSPIAKNLRIWIPLRKLMDKARRHREAELSCLWNDPEAVAKLAVEAQSAPTPSSPGLLGPGSVVEDYYQRWHQLVSIPEGSGSQPTQARTDSTMSHNHEMTDAAAGSPALMMHPHAAALVETQYGNVSETPGPLPDFTMDYVNSAWSTSDPLFQDLGRNFADPRLDLESDMDWHNWIETAKCIQ